MKKQCQFAVFCALVLFGTLAITPAACAEGQTRTYYVAVDEVDWDYTPMGLDQMMGMPFDKAAKMYVETDKHQIGRIYRKAVYREYTDGDDIRLVDWKVFARTDRHYVRLYDAERNLLTYLVVDKSASMDFAGAVHDNLAGKS